ncbi:MAG: hypothetical protein MHMPM18_003138, partial [Marteilia pararefringens]
MSNLNNITPHLNQICQGEFSDQSLQGSSFNNSNDMMILGNSDNILIDETSNIEDSISADYRIQNENQISQGEVSDQSLQDSSLNDSDDTMILGNSDNILIDQSFNNDYNPNMIIIKILTKAFFIMLVIKH